VPRFLFVCLDFFYHFLCNFFHLSIGFTDQPAGRFDLVALNINLDLTILQSRYYVK
jgi:hypothetical protein